MILPVQAAIRSALAHTIASRFSLADDDMPAIVIEVPPRRALGDLAVPVAFELARRLRKAPRAIAQDIARALDAIPGVARAEATPNGYLNFYLDRAGFLREWLGADRQPASACAQH